MRLTTKLSVVKIILFLLSHIYMQFRQTLLFLKKTNHLFAIYQGIATHLKCYHHSVREDSG